MKLQTAPSLALVGGGVAVGGLYWNYSNPVMLKGTNTYTDEDRKKMQKQEIIVASAMFGAGVSVVGLYLWLGAKK